VKLINIFRNHGVRAGTSLEHPHSQIIATPITPPHVRDPIVKLMRAYDTYGTCVYCDMLAAELRAKDRVVFTSDRFIVLSPFAARSPFETRIFPRRHSACFDEITDEEILDLAETLRITLKKIYVGLKNPDYNYVVHSCPLENRGSRFNHWYLIIVPGSPRPRASRWAQGSTST